MVHGPAVRLVNGDLLLVSVAHRKPDNTGVRAQVQNYFEINQSFAELQLGQLRLNSPGLGSKCGKWVERFSDF